MISHIDMYLFLGIYITLVLNPRFVELDDSEILGISRSSCRFEIHTSLLPWDEAYQACKHRGLTLASFGHTSAFSTMRSFIEDAQDVYSSKISGLESSKYWVGLHMESSAGGSSEFHWGDCVPDTDVTSDFESLTYSEDTACGYVRSDSLKLTACSNTVSMGFICENPNGMDSCFTKASTTMFSMGYESKTALTSSNCASKCLTSSDSCGAIYVTAGDSCSILRYDTDLSSSMSASHLVSTHYYPRRFLYNGPYSYSYIVDPTEDELCNLPLVSPIVTTTITDVTTTESIVPTTATEITTEPIDTSQPTEEITTVDVTTQAPEETTENDVTTRATEETTENDVTTEALEDTTDNDVTTQVPEETTENDVTTQALEDTTENDVTTQALEDTTENDVTTQEPEETTENDVTTQALEDTTENDVTTEALEDTTENDVTTQALEDTTENDVTTQEPEETTENDATTQAIVEATVGDGVSTTAQISVYNFSSCVCVCVEKNITLEEKIEQMVSELKVDTSVLSSTIREKACAEDPRPSARNVGILGIAIFTVLFGFIISLDFIRFFQAAERYIVRKEHGSGFDISG